MRPVMVLRPEPGNTATARAARARGLDAQAAPLFAYAPVPWSLPAAQHRDGLLIGSAAVIAHGGAGLDQLRTVPVHAVGPATARAAADCGFAIATTGSGGLQPLVARLPPGHYLRLAGTDHVPLDPPAGVQITTIVVYTVIAHPLGSAAIDRLAQGPVVVLLHSGQAARHFRAQCIAHELPRRQIALACLAPRIAAAAGDGWHTVRIAQNADDDAVLSLATQMCQTL